MGFMEDVPIPQAVKDLVQEKLRYRWLQKAKLAEQEQTLAAKFGGERCCLEMGETTMIVHPFFFHYWGERLGYECWDDEQFVAEFKRDNESVRVKNRSRHANVGWAEALDSGQGGTRLFEMTDQEIRERVMGQGQAEAPAQVEGVSNVGHRKYRKVYA